MCYQACCKSAEELVNEHLPSKKYLDIWSYSSWVTRFKYRIHHTGSSKNSIRDSNMRNSLFLSVNRKGREALFLIWSLFLPVWEDRRGWRVTRSRFYVLTPFWKRLILIRVTPLNLLRRSLTLIWVVRPSRGEIYFSFSYACLPKRQKGGLRWVTYSF